MDAGGAARLLNVHEDTPDIRDRYYEPPLIDLRVRLEPPGADRSPVLDQLSEGACTGFALATAINWLRTRRAELQNLAPPTGPVSPRMLYEMARLHDEWPGEDYDGSSIRGAIKGFYHNGVCSELAAPYQPGQRNWHLTIPQAKEARATGLGAYYRLRPQIIDYHAALNETGAVVVSARVHRGWRNPARGVIRRSTSREGGHAFVITGYDADGFVVQNSWGPGWGGFDGRAGVGHWSYEDWAENVLDAWVLRLAVPTPKAFDLTRPVARSAGAEAESSRAPKPRRLDVLGHIVHLDDGNLVETGRYGTPIESIRETAALLKRHGDAADADREYDHILIYGHGGLNGEGASARRVLALKDGFKRNRIYPIHLMWETGLAEELGDVFRNLFSKAEDRVGSGFGFKDWLIERTSRPIGRALWREMKSGAGKAFANASAGGTRALKTLLDANAASARPLQVHLVCHSAGSILHGELLKRWASVAGQHTQVHSMSVMAPACTLAFYEAAYRPALAGAVGNRTVRSLWQYNLVDSRETDDRVAGVYGKSLLYLVSNAFEEERGEALLGMEVALDGFSPPTAHRIFYAGRHRSRTDSDSHGGFDNDHVTMNDVLTHVLGRKPGVTKRFREEELRRH